MLFSWVKDSIFDSIYTEANEGTCRSVKSWENNTPVII